MKKIILFFSILLVLFLLSPKVYAQVDPQKIQHLYNIGQKAVDEQEQILYTPTALEVSPDDKYLFALDRHSAKIFAQDIATGEIKISFAGRGAGPGRLSGPEDLAVFQDSSGYHVWVTDAAAVKIFRFDCNLDMTSCPVWSAHSAGIGGTGSGQGLFRGLKGIAADQTGRIYVVDHSNWGKIQVLDRDGVFQKFIAGDVDPTSGTLSQPVDIALDRTSGDIFVTVTEPDHHIARFSEEGAPRGPIGCGPGKGCPVRLYYPTGIAVGRNSKIFVQDRAQSGPTPRLTGRRLLCINTQGVGSFCADESVSKKDLAEVLFYERLNVRGVAAKSNGELFAVEEGKGQILKFASPDESLANFTLVWGRGAEYGFFEYPRGLALDENFLSVSDGQGFRIILYNLENSGSQLIKAIDPLPRPGWPAGASSNKAGEFFVADEKAALIWRLNRAGLELKPHIGENPNQNPGFEGPTDVFFDNNENLYVLESGKSRILAFDKNFQFTHEIGGRGSRPDQFANMPISAAIGPDNLIYVVSAISCEIKVLSPDGQFRRTIGGQCASDQSSSPESLHRPVAITSDAENIYILENMEREKYVQVKIFKPDGSFVGKFADKFGAAEDALYYPTDISVSAGKVTITDGLLHRVSVWGEPTAPCVPETRLAGDLDCSCKVDDVDVQMVADIWHTCSANSKIKNCTKDKQFDERFDFKKDGFIDLYDVAYVLNKNGNKCQESPKQRTKITNRPPVVFTPLDQGLTLPPAKLGAFSYTGIIIASDFEGEEITFSLKSPLPEGLRPGSCPAKAKGEIKCYILGRPTQKGNFSLSFQAKDKTNPPVTVNIKLEVK